MNWEEKEDKEFLSTEFCSRYLPPQISCEPWYKGEKRPQKQTNPAQEEKKKGCNLLPWTEEN